MSKTPTYLIEAVAIWLIVYIGAGYLPEDAPNWYWAILGGLGALVAVALGSLCKRLSLSR